MNKRQIQYSESDLYGPDGQPHAADIKQDQIYNCYFVASAGALAEAQPDRIRDAIQYNPDTGEFTVRLYRPPNAAEKNRGLTDPIEQSISVSQEDIRYNIRREGGGTVDNRRDRAGPVWSTVIEAAFAELHGRDASGNSDLEKGYEIIGNRTRGGSLSDGMYALTGQTGRNIQIPSPDDLELVKNGRDYVQRPEPAPFKTPNLGYKLSVEAADTRVEQTLAAGQPVTLATQGREVRDGLMESHAYMVMGISKDAHTGDTLLRLRNPYGHNQGVGEGNHHIGSDWKASDPDITISLNDIVKKGSFGEFNIGPAPRVQTQTQTQSAATQTPQQAPQPSTPEPQAAAPLLSDPLHPGHALYSQALQGTTPSAQLSGGRFPVAQQQLIAANLVAGMVSLPVSRMHDGLTQEKLDRIDAVTLSSDGASVMAIEGKPGALAHFGFTLSLEQARSGSIEAASQQAFDGLQQQKAQEMARQAERERAPQPEPAGPAR